MLLNNYELFLNQAAETPLLLLIARYWTFLSLNIRVCYLFQIKMPLETMSECYWSQGIFCLLCPRLVRNNFVLRDTYCICTVYRFKSWFLCCPSCIRQCINKGFTYKLSRKLKKSQLKWLKWLKTHPAFALSSKIEML